MSLDLEKDCLLGAEVGTEIRKGVKGKTPTFL
jgi:hypothetical protein